MYPNFLPKASTSFSGLTPRERMKNIGVEGPKNEEHIYDTLVRIVVKPVTIVIADIKN